MEKPEKLTSAGNLLKLDSNSRCRLLDKLVLSISCLLMDCNLLKSAKRSLSCKKLKKSILRVGEESIEHHIKHRTSRKSVSLMCSPRQVPNNLRSEPKTRETEIQILAIAVHFDLPDVEIHWASRQFTTVSILHAPYITGVETLQGNSDFWPIEDARFRHFHDGSLVIWCWDPVKSRNYVETRHSHDCVGWKFTGKQFETGNPTTHCQGTFENWTIWALSWVTWP